VRQTPGRPALRGEVVLRVGTRHDSVRGVHILGGRCRHEALGRPVVPRQHTSRDARSVPAMRAAEWCPTLLPFPAFRGEGMRLAPGNAEVPRFAGVSDEKWLEEPVPWMLTPLSSATKWRTSRTEHEISGNNRPKISVSTFCPGSYPPFQPISGAQPGRIREQRAGSRRSGK
jgi:hypothetical protein